jgi:nitroreductase
VPEPPVPEPPVPAPPVPEIGLVEALYSLRALRRLAPDPVSDDDLRFLVDAATQAPSASNGQHWAFVVVTDREQRRRLGELYREVGRRVIRDEALASGRLAPETQRVYRNAMRLVEGLAEVPALIVVAGRGPHPGDPARAAAWYGSLFPAVQNLMLAARARGLGTTLTTLHKLREREVKAVLAIPDDWETVALIPVGRPLGSFGPPRRAPSAQVTHWERWGGRRDDPR